MMQGVEVGAAISACVRLAVGAIYCILAVATQLMIFSILAGVYVGLGALLGLGIVIKFFIDRKRGKL